MTKEEKLKLITYITKGKTVGEIAEFTDLLLKSREQKIKSLKVQNKSYAAHEKEVLDKFNQDKSLEQQIKELKEKLEFTSYKNKH